MPSLSGWIYHQLLLTNWVLFSTALFRREVFASVGNFDPDLPPADDWDLALRASRRFKFMKAADVVALYRQHPGQTSRRVMASDPQTRLRESMLLRYGSIGPDGQACDSRGLRQRRVASHVAFAASHAQHGGLRKAVAAEAQALADGPLDPRAWRSFFSVLLTIARRTPERLVAHTRHRSADAGPVERQAKPDQGTDAC